jgi:hypothetical protein
MRSAASSHNGMRRLSAGAAVSRVARPAQPKAGMCLPARQSCGMEVGFVCGLILLHWKEGGK